MGVGLHLFAIAWIVMEIKINPSNQRRNTMKPTEEWLEGKKPGSPRKDPTDYLWPSGGGGRGK